MTPEVKLQAIDHAILKCRAIQITDLTVVLDWVDYEALLKLAGVEVTPDLQRLCEGHTGGDPDCPLPVQTVRKLPIHVNKPPERSSMVLGWRDGNRAGYAVAT